MKTLRQLNGIAAAFAAGAMLIAADGALAHSGDHGHGSDSSQMKSHDSKSDHSDKHSDKYKDKSGDMRSDKHKDKDSKRAEKMKEKEEKRAEKKKEKDAEHAEKSKDKDKDKTTTTTTTATGTPAAGSKPAPGTPASGATPGPTAINTIHPIPSPPPAAVTGSGHGIVTVSDGKGNSIIIPDHGTGVTVTNAGPGHVTISNGVDSRTVSGIALNISGASSVSVDKSLGTGPRQADGSTTVLTPNGTVTGGAGSISGFLDGGSFEANSDGPVN